MESYKILYRGGTGEIVEKKSRFIASLQPVASEEEALEFIAAVRKQYWDARHNCFAYCIGRRGEIMRASDDGEPSQTAGKPMLDVLTGAGLHDVCAVVTRYFGGTLLGTGGLVRAYSQAVQEGLKNCVILEKLPGFRLTVTADYGSIGRIQYLAAQAQLFSLDSSYGEQAVFTYLVPDQSLKTIREQLTEATSGKAVIECSDPLYYGVADGKAVLFE